MAKVMYDGEIIEVSDKYSWMDFTGRRLVEKAALEGAVIYASCFSQEIPDREVFPLDIKELTLLNCNLDNVKLNPAWKVVNCRTNRFQVQKDLNDWIIDEHNQPVKPLNWKVFVRQGLPMPNPGDIPVVAVKDPIDLIAIAKSKG